VCYQSHDNAQSPDGLPGVPQRFRDTSASVESCWHPCSVALTESQLIDGDNEVVLVLTQKHQMDEAEPEVQLQNAW
jgi:hypothetical protein